MPEARTSEQPLTPAEMVREDRIHRRVYTDPAIFEMEMRRIFARSWIYVGHESQVAEPGDYFTVQVGLQPMFLIRHSDGSLHLLHNRCAHKGNQLLAPGTSGNLRVLRCFYHNWAYNTDGSFRARAGEAGYADTPLEKPNGQCNLRAAAQTESYRGFVFARLEGDGPGLVDWLGVGRETLDNLVDRAPDGELEVAGPPLRQLMDCNWKMPLENISDNMHAQSTHLSASQTAKHLADEWQGNEPVPVLLQALIPFGFDVSFYDDLGVTTFGDGHNYAGGRASINTGVFEDDEYGQLLRQKYGDEKARAVLGVRRHNTVLYPSAAFKTEVQTVRVFRPVSVDKTLLEFWTFRLKGAPKKVLQHTMLYNRAIFSPASVAAHDDAEAFAGMQRGLVSEADDWIKLSRHFRPGREDGPGTVAGTSEVSWRHQFRAWSRYMMQGEGGAE